MDQNSTRDGAEAILQARLTACTALFHDKMTPFLKIQTGALILQYEDAIKHLHKLSDEELDVLDNQFQDLQSHWSFLHGSLLVRAGLNENLIHLQQFLTASLLEDYDGRPYSPSSYARRCASMIIHDFDQARELDAAAEPNGGSADPTSNTSAENDQANTPEERRNSTANSSPSVSSGSDSEGVTRDEDNNSGPTGHESYGWDVLVPAAELMLDDGLVVLKLTMTDPTLRYPGGGEIKRLIDECDWARLRVTLDSDRDLAQALFNEHPVQKGTFNDTTRDAVLRGIAAVEKKYFTGGDCSAGKPLKARKHALGKGAALRSRSSDKDTHGGSQAVATKGRSWKYWETGLGKRFSSLYETLVGKNSDGASRGGRNLEAYAPSDVVSMSEKTRLLVGHIRRNEEGKEGK